MTANPLSGLPLIKTGWLLQGALGPLGLAYLDEWISDGGVVYEDEDSFVLNFVGLSPALVQKGEEIIRLFQVTGSLCIPLYQSTLGPEKDRSKNG